MMRGCAALALVTTALLTTGCGGVTRDTTPAWPESAGSAALQPDQPAVTQGTFATYSPGATAITYNTALVPPGSWAQLSIAEVADSTNITLRVRGLRPHRRYGAHLHALPCGAQAAMAGPHYQHQPEPTAPPSSPSPNPAYANPQNEVWLDLTTNSRGSGLSRSTQPWRFTMPARSLVLHAEKTQTTDGHAGMAGPRLACLTLPG